MTGPARVDVGQKQARSKPRLEPRRTPTPAPRAGTRCSSCAVCPPMELPAAHVEDVLALRRHLPMYLKLDTSLPMKHSRPSCPTSPCRRSCRYTSSTRLPGSCSCSSCAVTAPRGAIGGGESPPPLRVAAAARVFFFLVCTLGSWAAPGPGSCCTATPCRRHRSGPCGSSQWTRARPSVSCV